MSNRKKATSKAKEPIKLRTKQLANGNQSLYLDYYTDGQRQYEFLKLYLIPEKTPINKSTNVQTLELANAIKAQKIVELQNTAHGFSMKKARANVNVIDYIKELAERNRQKKGAGKRGTFQSYNSLINHIEKYSGNKTTFKQIDKKYCEGFIDYLRTATNSNYGKEGKTLNVNTQVGYRRMFETVFYAAIADEIMTINPFKQIKPENKPKENKTEIVYLTLDEVKALENAQCFNPKIKQAFLFSCYTGLRYSDVKGLTWGKLQKDNNGDTFINYVQKKTQKQQYLPIPQKAAEFLPNRSDAKDVDNVFNLPSGSYVNVQLKQWAFAANVTKNLSFHVARHTYATILLSLGAGIETISKNLGHSEIRTTQSHYAAIENKLQRQAVDLFDKLDGLTD